MAKTLEQINKQIASLSKQADELKKREVADVIKRIKEAIAVYGLTAYDLGFRKKPGRQKAAEGVEPQVKAKSGRGKPGSKAPVKYRDQSGNTWSGRGLQPRWLKAALQGGKKLDDFKA